MKQTVINIMTEALEALNQGWGLEKLPPVDVEVPKNEAMGDMAVTVAMRLAKLLKQPPRKIAEDIVSKVRELDPELFDIIEVAGPGFINCRFQNEFFHKQLETMLGGGHSILRSDIGKGQRVQVEFVSANPTGPMHIGHGRGAAVGDALCNLLKAAGYDVEKEYYINDAGLQVKLLGRSVFARYQQLLGRDLPLPEDGYHGDYIKSISEEISKQDGDKYLNSTFEECGEFISTFAYKMMLTRIASDLKKFGVIFDKWQSEKALYEKKAVQNALSDLREKKLIYDKDGAQWFASSKFEDNKDRVVIKKDGEFTYFASDIAYHKDKLDRGFDTIIDIWGADHHGYVPRVRSSLEAFGLPKDKFRVILIQMVSLLRKGEPIKMGKRSGQFVTLEEVVAEVGADITRFIFLTRRADSQLEFDIDLAKEQSSDNPVFYVQYAFARISSLFKQAKERKVEGVAGNDIQGADLSALLEDEEIALIKKLLNYPIVFEGAAHAFEPHRITYYLQELAGMFHAYYYKLRIVTDDTKVTLARLSLCKAVKVVLEEGLSILGVSAPKRM